MVTHAVVLTEVIMSKRDVNLTDDSLQGTSACLDKHPKRYWQRASSLLFETQ